MELDADALQNGTVSVLHARGIFRDGLPFDMPESDPLPPPRAIADLFPPTRDRIIVMLAIPAQAQRLQLRAGGGNPQARYVAEPRVVHDENTGADERPVRLGRKNLRLLLDTEPADDLLTLPLARVVRDGAGHFVLRPCLHPALPADQRQRTAHADGAAPDRDSGRQERHHQPARAIPGRFAEFSTREIASFWLMHAVNSALAPLRHLWISKRGHPEELFVEMSRLAGALCTFALDSHPRELPLYDHDNLSECFEALDRHIRAHLETIVPTNCVSIPLAPRRELLLRRRHHRPALPGPLAVDARHARRHGRSRSDPADAATGQGLLRGFRAASW